MTRLTRPEREDMEALYRAEVSCWGELAASLETMKERYDEHPDGYVAAWENDEVAGFTFGIRYDYDEVAPDTWHDAVALEHHTPEGKDLYIVSMTVAEEYQGQGIGRKVMEETKDRWRESDVDRIVLGSRDMTVGFFEKCGFDIVERKAEWWPEDEESNGYGIVMEHRL